MQTCMFRRSTPHQCSLVHIYTCSCITLIHVNLLSPSARGTRQHNQHMQTCVERHRARVLKRPQGKLSIYIYIDNDIDFGYLIKFLFEQICFV